MELVRLKYSHRAMIDQMITNPAISVRELAVKFGVGEQWIYKVRASNAFRELLVERTREMVDPVILAKIEENFDSMANRSFEVLLEKLSKPADEISDELALQAAQLGAKGRGIGGFGAKVAQAAAPPDPERLSVLANRLRNLNQPQGVIDVESREISRESQAGQARPE